MRQRSPVLVIVYTIITFGIYGLYWAVSTKNEMNQKYNAGIPTAWLIIVPIAGIYWGWKWCEGAQKTTNGGVSGAMLFVLFLVGGAIPIAGPVAMVLAQSAFNKTSAGAMSMQRAA
jgi:hypothetical protein